MPFDNADNAEERFNRAKRVINEASTESSKDKLIASFFTLIGGVTLIAAAFLYGIITDAYVTKILWSWYVVPTFNLAPLSMGQAFGVALLFGYLAWQHVDTPNVKREGRESAIYSLGLLARPWVILFFGWMGWHIFF
jgi:small-conductance mechanosensitive channel